MDQPLGDASVATPSVATFARGAMTPFRNVGVVLAIFSGNGAQALIFDALPPVLHQLAAHFGGGRKGELAAQLASTIPISGVMLSGLFAGLLVEKVGVRAGLLIGLAIFTAAGSAGYSLEESGPLLASRFVLGLGVGIMSTACSSLLAMRFQGAARSRMNGVLVGVGAAIGFGWLMASGYSASAFGWRAPFLLHPVWALIMIVPILSVGVFRAPPVEAKSPWRNLMRLGPVTPVYAVAAVTFMANSMFGVQMSFVLAAMGVTSPAQQAAALSPTPIGVAVASLAFGWLGPRVGWQRLMTLGYTLMVCALGIVAIAPDAGWIPFATTADGVALGLLLPSLWILAMQRAPHDLMPRAMGFMTTSLLLGAVLNPIVLAPVRGAVGLRGQYLAVAGVVVTGLLVAGLVAVIRRAGRSR